MKALDRIKERISDATVLLQGSSLKSQSLRGMAVFSLGVVGDRGCRLVRNMILARVIARQEFGLMAIVLTVTTVFEAFTEVGVRLSVIQNKDGADDDYLNAAWWLQAARGMALALLGIMVAPLIAHFYHKPQLTDLLRVAFLAVFFRGLVSPRMSVLLKQLKYGRAVLLTQGSGVIGTITAIGLTFVFRNVWALVIGFVAESAILCLLSQIAVPLVPRFRIHRDSLAKLLKFGRGLAGSPIMTIIMLNADVIVLGKMISDTMLGMYSLGSQLACVPATLYGMVVGPVLLPAFSKKQDEQEVIRRALIQVSGINAVVGIPLAALMASCAGSILSLFYGPEYKAVALPFALISIAVFLRIETSVFSQVYLGIGRPELHRTFTVLRAVIVVCLIYPAIRLYGMSGAAAVLVLSNLITLGAQVVSMNKLTGLRASVYGRSWLLGLATAVIVVVPAGFMNYMFNDASPWLIVSVVSTAYIGASLAGLLRLTTY